MPLFEDKKYKFYIAKQLRRKVAGSTESKEMKMKNLVWTATVMTACAGVMATAQAQTWQPLEFVSASTTTMCSGSIQARIVGPGFLDVNGSGAYLEFAPATNQGSTFDLDFIDVATGDDVDMTVRITDFAGTATLDSWTLTAEAGDDWNTAVGHIGLSPVGNVAIVNDSTAAIENDVFVTTHQINVGKVELDNSAQYDLNGLLMYFDQNSCPSVSDPDSDGDGIPDSTDSSPNNSCLPLAGNTFASTNCADISMVKSFIGSGTTNCPGAQSEWSLVVANAGPAQAISVVISDTPINATVISMTGGGCTAPALGATSTCNIGTMANLATQTVIVCTQ